MGRKSSRYYKLTVFASKVFEVPAEVEMRIILKEHDLYAHHKDELVVIDDVKSIIS